MDKVEFANEIAKKISEQNEDLMVEVYPEIVKNNGMKLTGLSIRKEGTNIYPTIYIDSMFNAKLTVDQAISDVMNIYDDSKGNMEDFDFNTIIDFNIAKNNIIAKVINKDRNEYIMDSCPYALFGDMIITFAIQVLRDEHNVASIRITNKLMNNWNVDLSDLIAAAYQNTKKMYKMKITKIQDLLYDLLQRTNANIDKKMLEDTSPDFIMYVVTSENKLNGSYYITDRESLIEVAQYIQSDEFYILPSSIHEFIVIPYDDKTADNTDEFLAMVKEANATKLSLDEILTDNVYIFNAKTEELRAADGTVIPFVS